MIQLSTILRGLSIDIHSYAIHQPVDLVHFLALAEIFHRKAAEVEQLEQASPLGGVDPLPDHTKTAAKEADVGVQDQARKRLLARMAGNIAAGILAQAPQSVDFAAVVSVDVAEEILTVIDRRYP